MKKIRVVQIIGIVLFLVYLILILLDIFNKIFGDYRLLIFSSIMAVVSLNMIFKGVIIRSSSTLWFAIFLIISSILIVVFEILKINIEEFYFVFAIIPIFSSLLNLVVFKNLIYIKVIIINLSILIPIIIQSFNNFNIWLNISIYIISILLGIIICRSINLNKENV